MQSSETQPLVQDSSREFIEALPDLLRKSDIAVLAQLKVMLSEDPTILNAKDEQGTPLIGIFARAHKLILVRYLLAVGANPNLLSTPPTSAASRRNALHQVLLNSESSPEAANIVVEILLQNNVDIWQNSTETDAWANIWELYKGGDDVSIWSIIPDLFRGSKSRFSSVKEIVWRKLNPFENRPVYLIPNELIRLRREYKALNHEDLKVSALKSREVKLAEQRFRLLQKRQAFIFGSNSRFKLILSLMIAWQNFLVLKLIFATLAILLGSSIVGVLGAFLPIPLIIPGVGGILLNCLFAAVAASTTLLAISITHKIMKGLLKLIWPEPKPEAEDLEQLEELMQIRDGFEGKFEEYRSNFNSDAVLRDKFKAKIVHELNKLYVTPLPDLWREIPKIKAKYFVELPDGFDVDLEALTQVRGVTYSKGKDQFKQKHFPNSQTPNLDADIDSLVDAIAEKDEYLEWFKLTFKAKYFVKDKPVVLDKIIGIYTKMLQDGDSWESAFSNDGSYEQATEKALNKPCAAVALGELYTPSQSLSEKAKLLSRSSRTGSGRNRSGSATSLVDDNRVKLAGIVVGTRWQEWKVEFKDDNLTKYTHQKVFSFEEKCAAISAFSKAKISSATDSGEGYKFTEILGDSQEIKGYTLEVINKGTLFITRSAVKSARR